MNTSGEKMLGGEVIHNRLHRADSGVLSSPIDE